MTTAPDVGRMAQSATQLPLDAITLIGLFTGPNGDTALIRMRDGDIHKVTPGETAGSLTLLAIRDNAAEVRDHRGNVFDLTLPDAA